MKRDGGFALLTALVVVGLAAALVASLWALVAFDTHASTRVRHDRLARQNAFVALQSALSQLQAAAGPDRRITAAKGGDGEDRHHTGVWEPGAGGEPVAWLVSPDTGAGGIEVVGTGSAAGSGRVAAPLVPLRDAAGAAIGNIAWWTGDQGVKATIGPTRDAAPEPADAGLLQQIGWGPSVPDFELWSPANRLKSAGIVVPGQIAALEASGTPLGTDVLRERFHAWTAYSRGVPADPAAGGLKHDLSVDAAALGPAFAAWANFEAYTENPAAPFAPAPIPAYGAEPLRRRVRLQAPLHANGVAWGVSPVLTYFLLTFNVRTQGGSAAVRPVEVRARWMVTLWNPYACAIVPEPLALEIEGLPESLQVVDETTGLTPALVPLRTLFGSPLRVRLPWEAASGEPDRQSWLPGRVHTWTALENTSGTIPPAGYPSRFNSRNLSADAGQGVQRPGGGVPVDGDDICHLAVAAPQVLTLRLVAQRADGDVTLATFTSPTFAPFTTNARKLSAGTYQFSYLFRLAESIDTPATPETWVSDAAREFRSGALGPPAFLPGPNGNRPELYENFVAIAAPDRLLDRVGTAVSFNEDVPLFELPRRPLLSIGVLQHLPLSNARPFSPGNSWGAAATVGGVPANALFDRHYFSGRSSEADPPRLVRGAFNVNAQEPAAWEAVLRSVRFPAEVPFAFLDAAAATGTAADDERLLRSGAPAQFFRFSQAAPETEKADDPTPASTYAASTTVRPAPPSAPSLANSHLFRRGRRELGSSAVAELAAGIATRNRARRELAGPWPSLEAFLDPWAGFAAPGGAPRNLLEAAIADAGLNAGVAEFSSQWLTSGDLLTALAPVLAARSDTFLIRAYGDSVDSTGRVRAAAWAEAVVQREFESAAVPALGRRFRVHQFRWLQPGEI